MARAGYHTCGMHAVECNYGVRSCVELWLVFFLLLGCANCRDVGRQAERSSGRPRANPDIDRPICIYRCRLRARNPDLTRRQLGRLRALRYPRPARRIGGRQGRGGRSHRRSPISARPPRDLVGLGQRRRCSPFQQCGFQCLVAALESRRRDAGLLVAAKIPSQRGSALHHRHRRRGGQSADIRGGGRCGICLVTGWQDHRHDCGRAAKRQAEGRIAGPAGIGPSAEFIAAVRAFGY